MLFTTLRTCQASSVEIILLYLTLILLILGEVRVHLIKPMPKFCIGANFLLLYNIQESPDLYFHRLGWIFHGWIDFPIGLILAQDVSKCEKILEMKKIDFSRSLSISNSTKMVKNGA